MLVDTCYNTSFGDTRMLAQGLSAYSGRNERLDIVTYYIGIHDSMAA